MSEVRSARQLLNASALSPKQRRKDNPAYTPWVQMRARCRNPNDSAYYLYGGRGIRVCERWQSFDTFLTDMGPRPAGMTIEREDRNGNYEPGNCRWATRKEQARNTSGTRYIEFNGERLCLTDWAARLGVVASGLGYRIKKYGVADALTKPRRNYPKTLQMEKVPGGKV